MGEYLANPDAMTKAAKGGYGTSGTLSVSGAPIMIDPFAHYGMWFGMDWRSAKRYVMEDGEWANETGAIFTAVADEVDTYAATYRIYDNRILERPNQCFRLDDITSNIAIAHIV